MFGDGIVSFGVTPSSTVALQELEVVGEDRVVEVDLLGRRAIAAGVNSTSPSRVAELDLDVARRPSAIAAELVDEVHVPGGAAELAVGRALQPDVALHLDDVADRVVLDRAQLARR